MSEVRRWNQQTGMLWMERDGLRLVIHLPPAKGYVRFAVIDRRGPNHNPERLIGSGTLEGSGARSSSSYRFSPMVG